MVISFKDAWLEVARIKADEKVEFEFWSVVVIDHDGSRWYFEFEWEEPIQD